MRNVSLLLRQFIDEESAQGISEYGAMLAFVAILVALVFAMSTSSTGGAISSVYSTMCDELNSLTNSASGSSS